jgi:predicted ArsR family transcriptional regulator
MLSDQYELDILRQLRRGGWHSAGEIAAELELPIWAVRARLSELRRRHMVERGGPGHWGQWSITERGLQELADAEQLRLVR